MMPDWLHGLASGFTPERYMVWSRIQGTLWTAADLVLVFYLLRTANLARRLFRVRPHRASYAILLLTVPFAALIPFAPDPTAFFRLELLVTVPHFMIILYVLAMDMRYALRLIDRLVRTRRGSVLHPGEGDALDEIPLRGEEQDDDGRGHQD